jgi:D-alanine---D-serine ligase
MKKIAIIFGGCNSEYEVSLQSAYGVIKNIERSKYDPVLIGINREGRWFLFEGSEETIAEDTWHKNKKLYPIEVSMDKKLHGILIWRSGWKGEIDRLSLDGAFPVLHGLNGEDGTVQGMLALAGIPIIGCGTLASAVCMDKNMAHHIVKEAGVMVPKSRLLSLAVLKKPKEKVKEYAKEIGYPLFIKPLRAGSSFGISKVDKQDDLGEALELAFTYDDQVIIEEMITGFEAGCAVMGKERLIIGEVDEIELSHGFFDYTEKYTLKTSRIHVPARISKEKAEEIKQTAAAIYRSLGCDSFARVDMFLTPDGRIYFNEVNTIPGFTEHSRFPGMMKEAGISMKKVVNGLIDMVVK